VVDRDAGQARHAPRASRAVYSGASVFREGRSRMRSSLLLGQFRDRHFVLCKLFNDVVFGNSPGALPRTNAQPSFSPLNATAHFRGM
jgi:hypothetical protein